MHNLIATDNIIPSMSEMAINSVRQLEFYTLKAPQTEIPTSHIFHAGVYARTIVIPKDVILTGALIKRSTLLVMSGDVVVYIGDEAKEMIGNHVFAASANRKQAFVARTDTYLTMIFATDAMTVDDAEEEFTDEFERLSSRSAHAINTIIITGE